MSEDVQPHHSVESFPVAPRVETFLADLPARHKSRSKTKDSAKRSSKAHSRSASSQSEAAAASASKQQSTDPSVPSVVKPKVLNRTVHIDRFGNRSYAPVGSSRSDTSAGVPTATVGLSARDVMAARMARYTGTKLFPESQLAPAGERAQSLPEQGEARSCMRSDVHCPNHSELRCKW